VKLIKKGLALWMILPAKRCGYERDSTESGKIVLTGIEAKKKTWNCLKR